MNRIGFTGHAQDNLPPYSQFRGEIKYSDFLPHIRIYQATAQYMFHMSMLIASYGLVVGTNYLIVFVLLVAIYYKILKRIKRMRRQHG